MQKKFNNTATEIWSDILKLATTNAEYREQWQYEFESNPSEQNASELSTEMMNKYQNGFIVLESEAQKLLSGHYNNERNRKIVQDCLAELANRELPMPLILRHLIHKFYRRKLNSGILLEFTARLFNEHLKQLK